MIYAVQYAAACMQEMSRMSPGRHCLRSAFIADIKHALDLHCVRVC